MFFFLLSLYHVVFFLLCSGPLILNLFLLCDLMEWIASLLAFSHQIFFKPWDLPLFPLSQYMNQNGNVSVGAGGREKRGEWAEKKNLLSEKMLVFKGLDLRGTVESLANLRIFPSLPPAQTPNMGDVQYWLSSYPLENFKIKLYPRSSQGKFTCCHNVVFYSDFIIKLSEQFIWNWVITIES